MKTGFKKRSSGFTLVELLVVIAIIGILVGLLLPAVQAAREAARRMSCSNNLKNVGLAIHNYHDTYKVFPHGSIAAALNNSVATPASQAYPGAASWLQPILPFIEQGPLYDQYAAIMNSQRSADMPSDLINTIIPTMFCPSDPNSPKDTTASGTGLPTPDHNDGFCGNYLACHGSELLTEGAGGTSVNASGIFYYRSKNGFKSIVDGTSNTVMLGEISVVPEPAGGNRDWRGRYWRSDHNSALFSTRLGPNTTTPDGCRTCQGSPASPIFAPCTGTTNNQAIYLRSYHPGGVQVTLADASVRFVGETIDLVTWNAVGTRQGYESVQLP